MTNNKGTLNAIKKLRKQQIVQNAILDKMFDILDTPEEKDMDQLSYEYIHVEENLDELYKKYIGVK